jgi:hypothetical protein
MRRSCASWTQLHRNTYQLQAGSRAHESELIEPLERTRLIPNYLDVRLSHGMLVSQEKTLSAQFADILVFPTIDDTPPLP